MDTILFFDLEIDAQGRLAEAGGVLGTQQARGRSWQALQPLFERASVLAGHNLLRHDLPMLDGAGLRHWHAGKPIADTLLLSVLLFPEKPYHRLVKDYKLLRETANDPVADSLLAREVWQDALRQFQRLPEGLRRAYAGLLGRVRGFDGFFGQAGHLPPFSWEELEQWAQGSELLCADAERLRLWRRSPIELALALAIAHTQSTASILPPWLLAHYPKVEEALHQLRATGCGHCAYCAERLDPRGALQRYFGYPGFRRFGKETGMPLQETAVRAALADESFLAIFPTGGGKSLTFQLPALLRGDAKRSLTVVISPLQALMKDQVDVLERRFQHTSAVAINGLLSPLERSHALERVADGGAHLLYISPESLRSRTIFDLLAKRSLERFVIDEAHCFSAWGQDFRPDYLYIGTFMRRLQEAKGLARPIPVSCFTATAKPQVEDEIVAYFREKLGVGLRVFRASALRENLRYQVIKVADEGEKYMRMLQLLDALRGRPAIVYVSRTKEAERLAERLQASHLEALCYHGKMEAEAKKQHQEDFIAGRVNVMVATTAFGMGVDKDNVEAVIHYDISSSLENYSQEAGRAGRNEHLQATCYVLFNEADLGKHFQMLRFSKLSIKEIQQFWQGVKELTKRRLEVSKSALELAKAAGWEADGGDVENRVRAALAVLEQQRYVERGFNRPRVFADSILAKSVEEGLRRIDASPAFEGPYRAHAVRIFKSIFQRSKTEADLDRLSERLGIPRDEAITALRLMRQEGLIGDARDLSVFISKGMLKNHSRPKLRRYAQLSRALLQLLPTEGGACYLKEMNTRLQEQGVEARVDDIKLLLLFWKKLGWMRYPSPQGGFFEIGWPQGHTLEELRAYADALFALADRQLGVLFELPAGQEEAQQKDRRVLVVFSMLELQRLTQQARGLFEAQQADLRTQELALLLLQHLEAVELKDGFLIFYSPMEIRRLEENNLIKFKKQDYQRLEQFYEHRIEQIHIVGEYAKKMLHDYEEALSFVNDYFTLPYAEFLAKHFPGKRREEIKRAMTDEQFRMLMEALSAEQAPIVSDQSAHLLVLAGPGSGKTHVLVRKIAAALQLDDVKPEQFLMLTFSRAAAYEFKRRLHQLIGAMAYAVDIFTFHGFAFELLGRMGSADHVTGVIEQALEALQEETVLARVAGKNMLVIDEFQDLGAHEFRMLVAILERAGDIRSVAVGDDDQNVFDFRGSDIAHFRAYAEQFGATRRELLQNFRSRANLVELSNAVAQRISQRMKQHPLAAKSTELGRIEVVEYTGTRHLFIPATAGLPAPRKGETVAMLVHTNKDADILLGLLRGLGLPTASFANHDDFRIWQLQAMRAFCELLGPTDNAFIDSGRWEAAKQELRLQVPDSEDRRLAERVIGLFEEQYSPMPASEWPIFLKEIKVEDLGIKSDEKIFVSTLHRAKGLEFDRVVLLLNQPYGSDEALRLLYVGLTRAKKRLDIHVTHAFFAPFAGRIPGLSYRIDAAPYRHPKRVALSMGLADAWLNFFKHPGTKATLGGLRVHEALFLSADGTYLQTAEGRAAVAFSKIFQEKIQQWRERGYWFSRAAVLHLVYWYDKMSQQEVLVALAQVELEREDG